MALDLVRGFSKGSWISKRLWKTIRILKEVGPKLGLRSREEDPQGGNKGEMDPNRSAAVAMAGLAGHNVDEMALYPSNSWSAATGASSSPEGMVNDLTSLFEAAGGYQAIGSSNADGLYIPNTSGEGVDGLAAAFGGDEGLSNILKELF